MRNRTRTNMVFQSDRQQILQAKQRLIRLIRLHSAKTFYCPGHCDCSNCQQSIAYDKMLVEMNKRLRQPPKKMFWHLVAEDKKQKD